MAGTGGKRRSPCCRSRNSRCTRPAPAGSGGGCWFRRGAARRGVPTC